MGRIDRRTALKVAGAAGIAVGFNFGDEPIGTVTGK